MRVYEGVWTLFKVYEGIWKYMKVYKVYPDILTQILRKRGEGREGKERETSKTCWKPLGDCLKTCWTAFGTVTQITNHI